jgi:hypothetical protein
MSLSGLRLQGLWSIAYVGEDGFVHGITQLGVVRIRIVQSIGGLSDMNYIGSFKICEKCGNYMHYEYADGCMVGLMCLHCGFEIKFDPSEFIV